MFSFKYTHVFSFLILLGGLLTSQAIHKLNAYSQIFKYGIFLSKSGHNIKMSYQILLLTKYEMGINLWQKRNNTDTSTTAHDRPQQTTTDSDEDLEGRSSR